MLLRPQAQKRGHFGEGINQHGLSRHFLAHFVLHVGRDVVGVPVCRLLQEQAGEAKGEERFDEMKIL